MSVPTFMPWACDGDAELVWIRRDLARAGDLAALPNIGGVLYPEAVLVEVAEVVMCGGLGEWPEYPGEVGPWIWEAHDEDHGDEVCVYVKYEQTEDREPGDRVLAFTSTPEGTS